jgi:LysM repeat protein
MAVVMNLLRSRLIRRSAAVLLLAVAVLACIDSRKPCGTGAAACTNTASGDITGSLPGRSASAAAPHRVAPPTAKAPRAVRHGRSIAWKAATTVTVRRGETVDDIARQHGVPTAAILKANQLPDRTSIWTGQLLVVPLS